MRKNVILFRISSDEVIQIHIHTWNYNVARYCKKSQSDSNKEVREYKECKKINIAQSEETNKIFHGRSHSLCVGSTRHPGEWTTGLCCARARRRVIHCGKSEQGDAVKVSCFGAWDQVCAMSFATTVRPLGTATWFISSHQLSTRQPLAHSPVGWERDSEG